MEPVGVVKGAAIKKKKKTLEGKNQIPQPWLWQRRKKQSLGYYGPALSGVPQGTCAF